jgi:hypothetical protein
MEPHGTIIAGRWRGTRAAEVARRDYFVIVRPFNDTAESEDAQIHLDPSRLISIGLEEWELDNDR